MYTKHRLVHFFMVIDKVKLFVYYFILPPFASSERQAVTKKRKHSGPVRHLSIPQLDEEKYFDLVDILYGSIFMGNRAALSRLLGVSIPTIAAMRERPPGKGKQWWWNIVLRTVIQRMYEQLRDSPHRKDNKKAGHIRTNLERTVEKGLLDQLTLNEERDNGCAQYLLATLTEQPKHRIKIDQLKAAGYSGGYQMRTFQQAALRLCLIREKRKGEWYWRLPTLTDCD